ncbi:cytochrome P450 [Aspergillus homomorphus CBS 101889]|uniref:Cytochrome P450 n=1 Tax=Aspergillus homomorphus (strain CBS 101889) TaxID=1450537 RepID=A0A395I4S2_ASPHC|nr:cytochrome P450 [Aspergillus homomorphus CBS 101889]RAL15212.1 cytochrome P450 [Aspergillus homomorphus CBS 101889]
MVVLDNGIETVVYLSTPSLFTPLKHLPTPHVSHSGNGDSCTLEVPYVCLQEYVHTIPNQGLLRYYVVGNLEQVITISSKVLSELLVLRQVLGEGLLLSEWEVHKVSKSPTKHLYLQRLMPAFVYRYIIVRLIHVDMNHNFNSLHDTSIPLYKSYQKLTVAPSQVIKTFIIIGMLLGSIDITHCLPTKHNRDIYEGGTAIRDNARQIIRLYKIRIHNEPGGSSSVDIISTALGSGIIDNDNRLDQLMTFLGADHETIATAMHGTSESVDAATIAHLSYLSAICNEVLRFYPPVPSTFCIANKDTTLAGQDISKGTVLIISPKIVNQMEELWGPDAKVFNPDRFMEFRQANAGGASTHYAFLTFLHGPRGCIGQSFAKLELACLLTAMIGRLHMELAEPDRELELREDVTVSPKDGVLAKLTPLVSCIKSPLP